MGVRAKMRCDRVSTFATGYREVQFTAVTGNKDENKDFADATPTGQLSMGISPGRKAGEFFEPGKSYFLDFSEAAES